MEPLKLLLERIFDLFKWFVIVRPWELGIRVRVGKHVKDLEPGIHLRIPIFDEAFVQSVRLRVSNCPTQTVQTRDHKILTVGATVQYVIEDIRKLYNSVHQAEDTIVNLVMQAVAEEIAATHSDNLSPEGVSGGATKRIQFGRYGIKPDARIRITDFVIARTYRLITDSRDPGLYGEALNTSTARQVNED